MAYKKAIISNGIIAFLFQLHSPNIANRLFITIWGKILLSTTYTIYRTNNYKHLKHYMYD